MFVLDDFFQIRLCVCVCVCINKRWKIPDHHFFLSSFFNFGFLGWQFSFWLSFCFFVEFIISHLVGHWLVTKKNSMAIVMMMMIWMMIIIMVIIIYLDFHGNCFEYFGYWTHKKNDDHNINTHTHTTHTSIDGERKKILAIKFWGVYLFIFIYFSIFAVVVVVCAK